MRWRYIKVTLIGALLGFAGQFMTDFFCWNAFCVGKTSQQILSSGFVDRALAECYHSQNLQPQAHLLIYQLMTLRWLSDRGEIAGRTAAVAALLGASAVLATDQIRQARKALS